jgi:hypothetical protein
VPGIFKDRHPLLPRPLEHRVAFSGLMHLKHHELGYGLRWRSADLRRLLAIAQFGGHHPVVRPKLATEDLAVSLHDEFLVKVTSREFSILPGCLRGSVRVVGGWWEKL